MRETCRYKNPEGELCNVPIMRDANSLTGWRHVPQAEWFHWATPVEHDYGNQSDQFVPCVVCGQTQPDNPQHLLYAGHKFQAVEQ